MNVSLLTALVYLLTEALASGMKLSEILSKVNDAGEVPDDKWAALEASLSKNEKPWLLP